MMRRFALILSSLVLLSHAAFAQDELPLEGQEIDLANIVTAAAKGVTTVQEAPAIITIITADEIKARGEKWILEATSTVPGWFDVNAEGSQIQHPLVRGVSQDVLLMRDGVSLFDPWGNIPQTMRTQPVETIKRIELVTGPGGVLWGANSFLGIANVITKDAEDVNGIEASAGYGDGPGNKQDFKAYAMFGKTLLNGKLKIFQHVSYETWLGQIVNVPQIVAYSPPPQPTGPIYVDAPQSFNPTRSWEVMIDGKYSYGPVSLYYSLPFGDDHAMLGFGNVAAPGGSWNVRDRYGILEYKDRFFKDRFGLTVKGYGVQFVREGVIQVVPPSILFPATANEPGGLSFSIMGQQIFRAGATIDGDVTLPFGLRLLVGGELFYEGIRDSNARFLTPSDPNKLPILCPVDANGMRLAGCPRTLVYDTGRYVAAGYADLQWRATSTLTFDGGVRLQQGMGQLGYKLTPLYSGALVWSFLPQYHLKINYANGFRAPVFQATSSAPGGVNIGANPNLRTESSQSVQGEINARILRNVHDVRELELRVDYSYSVLSDLIQIRGGAYGNTGRRAIHSVEGYARLYLVGDHFLQASYTYLQAQSTDSGVLRAMPNHVFVVGGSFNVVKQLLDVNANLSIFGAHEDVNRYPSASGAPIAATLARPTDLTFDRMSAVALLQLGVRVHLFRNQVEASAQFYNVLNAHYAYVDNFYDLTPTLDSTPNPAPGFSAFGSITYHYGF